MATTVDELVIELRGRVEKLQQDMERGARTLQKFEKRFQNIGNKMATAFGAALGTGILVAMKNLSKQVMELADQGERLGSIEEGFRALGGSSKEIRKAQNAALGLVDSYRLMEIANKGLVANVPEIAQNFSKIADLGARAANTLGTDAAGAIDQLTTALIKAKPKQLEAFGIIVREEEAWKAYADSVGKGVNQLTTGQKVLAVQAQAMAQLEEASTRLTDVTISASNAQAQINVTMQENQAVMAKAINQSPELIRALQDYNAELEKHRDVADEAGLAVAGLQAKWIQLKTFFAQGAFLKQANDDLDRMVLLIKQLYKGGFGTEGNIFAEVDKQFKELRKNQAGELIEQQFDQVTKAIGNFQKQIQTGTPPTKLQVASLREEFEALQEKLKDTDDSRVVDALATVERHLEAVEKQAVKSGTAIAKMNDRNLTQLNQEAQAQKKVLADREKAAKKLAAEEEKFAERRKQIYEEGNQVLIDGLREAAAIFGAEMGETFQQLADGFAAALELYFQYQQQAQASGTVNGSGDLLGGLNSFFGTGASFGGAGMSAEDAYAAGYSGPATESGSFGGDAGMTSADYMGYAQAAYSIWNSAEGIGDSTEGSVVGGGTVVGAAIGGYFGGGQGAAIGAQIGGAAGQLIVDAFGLGGPSHPETLARIAATEALKQIFDDYGTKLLEDAGLDPHFADNFNNYNAERDFIGLFQSGGGQGDGSFFAYDAIGKVIGEKLGIDDLQVGQLGPILADAFSGSADALKDIIAATGITFEEVQQAITEAALAGEQTWLGWLSTIRDTREAFEPGLTAVGDFVGGVERIAESAGTGRKAITALVTTAVEAREAGITTFEDLRAQLEASGEVSSEIIAALFHGLSLAGVQSLDQLEGASTEVLGTIIAHMDAFLQDNGTDWRTLAENIGAPAEQLQEINDNLDAIDGREVTATVRINTVETGSNAAGISPITGGSTRSFSGPALEGGGSPRMILSIDARGAGPGVEHQVEAAIRRLEPRILQNAMGAMVRRQNVGGMYPE